MMRKVFAAALVLSPMLLHAQVNSPAQPQTSTLQAKLGQPKELAVAANSPRTAAATPTGAVRISTGVIAPKLIHTVDITTSSNDLLWQAFPTSRKVVVGMIVDETGKPTDLKIGRSAGVTMDRTV